jgi:DNA topoisomerase-1
MDLIFVESPTKARTLTRFLGTKYKVEATMGHVRDLPKSELGVDEANNFTPKYIVPRDKSKRVGELRKIAKKAKHIILATDPDREGEAIAFHIAKLLEEKDKLAPSLFSRIVFHEITKGAIEEALKNPRGINQALVDAQQARRVLDRLVGYKLSPLLWQKLSKRWLSAGRVQSVAVRLIVEREREIVKFAKEEFWTIDGMFLIPNAGANDELVAALVSKYGEKYEKTLSYDLFDGTYTTTSSIIRSEPDAQKIVADLKSPFTVAAVDKKEIKHAPAAPFTTSTLQQEAGRRFYFSAKRTMQLAQKLYEEGLISYHRTDSVNLSEKFIAEARGYIGKTMGDTYVAPSPRRFKTKSKGAQEAHEAIRPTDVARASVEVGEADMNRDHTRLYELIWKRAVASQAADAIFDSTTIVISSANGYTFQTQGSVVKFDGFLKILGRDTDEVVIPKVAVGEALTLKSALPTKHETAPPPRYSEASLVKTLEEKGIGRPSTYAPILSTIQERQYVVKEEKRLAPTELGNSVTDFLVQYFPGIMELPFTAEMEAKLDGIADDGGAWQDVIRLFYEPFAKLLNTSYEEAQKVKIVEEKLDEPCPTCGNPLVIRMGRYGKFVACSTFPACKYTRQFAEKIGEKCPRCGGDVVIKKTRRGKMFYGCSNYPTCTFAAWKKEDIHKPQKEEEVKEPTSAREAAS